MIILIFTFVLYLLNNTQILSLIQKGPREQMNQLTAYLDLSFMYGSDKCEASILRSHSGGRMNTTKNPLGYGKPLLPQTTENPECRAKSGICFNAGK